MNKNCLGLILFIIALALFSARLAMYQARYQAEPTSRKGGKFTRQQVSLKPVFKKYQFPFLIDGDSASYMFEYTSRNEILITYIRPDSSLLLLSGTCTAEETDYKSGFLSIKVESDDTISDAILKTWPKPFVIKSNRTFVLE